MGYIDTQKGPQIDLCLPSGFSLKKVEKSKKSRNIEQFSEDTRSKMVVCGQKSLRIDPVDVPDT